MHMAVNRLEEINLNFGNQDSNNGNSANNQREEIDIFKNFDLISLNNKERNKQDIQEAAKLFSLIKSDESGDFENACCIYLTKKTNNAQVRHSKRILELINVIRDYISVAATTTLRNFGNRVNLYTKDFATYLGSAISVIGGFCCDLCEAIFTTRNKELKYSEVPCQWI